MKVASEPTAAAPTPAMRPNGSMTKVFKLPDNKPTRRASWRRWTTRACHPVNVHNNRLRKCLGMKTPNQVFFGIKANCLHLRVESASFLKSFFRPVFGLSVAKIGMWKFPI